MSESKETLEIQNVVASTELSQELKLEQLADDLPTTEYRPESFPGLIFRTQSPKAATLIFRSGKAVCTGAKSVRDVNKALEVVFNELQTLGITIESSREVQIQNIVSSGDLDHRLNLNAIAIGIGLKNIEYEPEQFPGLVYRLETPDVVILLFGSGKAVVTGATSIGEAELAFETVESELQELDLINK
ncbi:TATA-box-binding protein [Haloplanus sp. C73]|jgi:transcription initiation factor TFIID TATA-box-binding protein|uniref:TATA-box-binding protein n=1 Tax=Haloplanus sp. C73 TaxID=3421641 RepID=UPI003EBC6518